MKILLGIIIGAGLALSYTALAASGSFSVGPYVLGNVGGYSIYKFIDHENGVLCYVTGNTGYSGGGISCLRN